MKLNKITIKTFKLFGYLCVGWVMGVMFGVVISFFGFLRTFGQLNIVWQFIILLLTLYGLCMIGIHILGLKGDKFEGL